MENKDTIIVYTYKYVWQTKDGKLCVKYVTEPLQAHAQFIKDIQNESNVVACYREYISEVNFAFINFTECIKEKDKEGENE